MGEYVNILVLLKVSTVILPFIHGFCLHQLWCCNDDFIFLWFLLYSLFGIFLLEVFVPSPSHIYLLNHFFTAVWTHGYLFYPMGWFLSTLCIILYNILYVSCRRSQTLYTSDNVTHALNVSYICKIHCHEIQDIENT